MPQPTCITMTMRPKRLLAWLPQAIRYTIVGREQEIREQDKGQSEQGRSAPGEPQSDFVMERFGRLRDADRSFDVEYWQRQGDAAVFEAAWELAEFYHRAGHGCR